MSDCTHPTSALYVDRSRGVTHCTLCGDVVVDQQFELDPIFSRVGGGGGAKSGVGSGAGAGAFRPTRGPAHTLSTHARPTIDNARRGMSAIARTLELSDDMVEMALGIYKIALTVNAVSGARHAVLCACLYAICRRERTPHVIYDFAALRQESPHVILAHMRHICEATHTDVPTLDIACLVQRFAEQMDLGDALSAVTIGALKVLRMMQDDWIACGRRPMGVCAAALLVACSVFHIPRSPADVCQLVRLTADTIGRRLTEFALTPAAALESIDAYRPSPQSTLPPAFTAASRRATEEDVNAAMRALSATYYELVAQAKESAPATPARCATWRQFIIQHCALEQVTPQEVHLDLTRLSSEAQLRILGLPHTRPMPRAMVEQSVKRETERLWRVKREEEEAASSSSSPLLMKRSGVRGSKEREEQEEKDMLPSSSLQTHMSAPSQTSASSWSTPLEHSQQQQHQQKQVHQLIQQEVEQHRRNEMSLLSSWRHAMWKAPLTSSSSTSSTSSSSSHMARAWQHRSSGDAAGTNTSNGMDFNDPAQLRRLTERYTAMLNNAEVRELRADFDWADVQGRADAGGVYGNRDDKANARHQGWSQDGQASPSPQAPWSRHGRDGDLTHEGASDHAHEPFPLSAPDADETSAEAFREAVEAMLHDGDRRHALPWQIVILQVDELEDSTDLLPYIILDNEERLRRAKVGESLYGEKWNRGRVPVRRGGGVEVVAGGVFAAEKTTKRRRHVIERPASVPDALERVLRGRGAATVHAAHIHELLPGLMGEDDEDGNGDGETMDEWS